MRKKPARIHRYVQMKKKRRVRIIIIHKVISSDNFKYKITLLNIEYSHLIKSKKLSALITFVIIAFVIIDFKESIST